MREKAEEKIAVEAIQAYKSQFLTRLFVRRGLFVCLGGNTKKYCERGMLTMFESSAHLSPTVNAATDFASPNPVLLLLL